MSFKKSLTNS
ncbi:UNVERIFIED_CONTAM: hypothetical protein GTU68_032278 [Idotea baltica]|nr:hypothetical protein [Idotea baltica]